MIPPYAARAAEHLDALVIERDAVPLHVARCQYCATGRAEFLARSISQHRAAMALSDSDDVRASLSRWHAGFLAEHRVGAEEFKQADPGPSFCSASELAAVNAASLATWRQAVAGYPSWIVKHAVLASGWLPGDPWMGAKRMSFAEAIAIGDHPRRSPGACNAARDRLPELYDGKAFEQAGYLIEVDAAGACRVTRAAG